MLLGNGDVYRVPTPNKHTAFPHYIYGANRYRGEFAGGLRHGRGRYT